jgi:hypothetical protein
MALAKKRLLNKIENKWIEKFSASYKVIRKKPLITEDYKKKGYSFNIKFLSHRLCFCGFLLAKTETGKMLIFKNTNPTS